MKVFKRVALATIVLALTVFAFTACEDFLAALGASAEAVLYSVNGEVVDSRASDLSGVEGVTVTLTPVTQPDSGETVDPIEVTTDSTGDFSATDVESGTYRLTAAKDGWFFIPQTVSIGGLMQSLPEVLGVELESSTAISFVLVWNETYKDVDGHLTFPDGSGTGNGFEGSHTPVTSSTFTSPNEAWPTGGGFGPDVSTNREAVYPANAETAVSDNTVGEVLGGDSTDPAIELDRDDRDGSGPEVITVRTLPFWPSTYTNSIYTITGDGADNGNYLPTTHDWAWIGVMEYYIDGWNADDSTAGSWETTGNLISTADPDDTGADAVVFVVQGSKLLGKFVIPSFANIRTASVVRVNLFVGDDGSEYATYFQIVPDIQIVDGRTSIKQTGGVTGGVIGAFGASR